MIVYLNRLNIDLLFFFKHFYCLLDDWTINLKLRKTFNIHFSYRSHWNPSFIASLNVSQRNFINVSYLNFIFLSSILFTGLLSSLFHLFLHLVVIFIIFHVDDYVNVSTYFTKTGTYGVANIVILWLDDFWNTINLLSCIE